MYKIKLTQHKKNIILEALKALRMTPFCAEDNFNEFDTIILEAFLKYDIDVSISDEKMKTFSRDNGVDFPIYTNQQVSYIEDVKNCRLYSVRYTEQEIFNTHSLGFFTDANGFDVESIDAIYALKLNERIDFNCDNATVIRIR